MKYCGILYLACIFLSAKAKLSLKPSFQGNNPRNPKNDVQLLCSSESKPPCVKQTQFGAFIVGMLSGAIAGATTDMLLFPIDTIKTRLQSKAGITFSLGMLANMYNGIVPALAASAPSAATFFGAYDGLQKYLRPRFKEEHAPFVHIISACGGNLAQSAVRVPFELIKQRLQVFNK